MASTRQIGVRDHCCGGRLFFTRQLTGRVKVSPAELPLRSLPHQRDCADLLVFSGGVCAAVTLFLDEHSSHCFSSLPEKALHFFQASNSLLLGCKYTPQNGCLCRAWRWKKKAFLHRPTGEASNLTKDSVGLDEALQLRKSNGLQRAFLVS